MYYIILTAVSEVLWGFSSPTCFCVVLQVLFFLASVVIMEEAWGSGSLGVVQRSGHTAGKIAQCVIQGWSRGETSRSNSCARGHRAGLASEIMRGVGFLGGFWRLWFVYCSLAFVSLMVHRCALRSVGSHFHVFIPYELLDGLLNSKSAFFDRYPVQSNYFLSSKLQFKLFAQVVSFPIVMFVCTT